MLCQQCQKRMANVHFTQVFNNKKMETYLCEQCAREKGQSAFGAPLSINDIFSGLVGFAQNQPYMTAPAQNVSCETCGMTYEEFRKTGKLGCANCYAIFEEKFKPLLKRLHGNENHQGKIPSRLSTSIKATREIDSLKEQLNAAIQKEEYEKAAALRDRIKLLESANQG